MEKKFKKTWLGTKHGGRGGGGGGVWGNRGCRGNENGKKCIRSVDGNVVNMLARQDKFLIVLLPEVCLVPLGEDSSACFWI